MKNLITMLAVLLLVSVGANIWQWLHPRTIKAKGDVVYLPSGEKTVVYNLPSGNQSATAKISQEYREKTERAKELVEVVKTIPDLEKEKEIVAITAVNAKLQLELSEKDLAINDKEKQIKEWKDKFNSVKVDNSANAVSVVSEVSPKIATTEKREKFLSPKEQFTTITSENPAIKFYGIESYTFKNPKQKDFVELNLKLQGLYLNEIIIPYGGAEIQFNPDGKLKPIVGYGYWYDNNSGKLFPYWFGGVQVNLIRF